MWSWQPVQRQVSPLEPTWFIMLHDTVFAPGLKLREKLPRIVLAGLNSFSHGLCTWMVRLYSEQHQVVYFCMLLVRQSRDAVRISMCVCSVMSAPTHLEEHRIDEEPDVY